MSFRNSDDRRASLLISMLVRYPEVARVNYDPRQQTVRMGLLIAGGLSDSEFEKVQRELNDTIDVYKMLDQRQPLLVEINRDAYGDLTALSVTRDVHTFTPEEIYTVVEFFRERFQGRLVSEYPDYVGEDEMIAQDEMIQEALADLHAGRSGKNLIAIREEGRVIVFRK